MTTRVLVVDDDAHILRTIRIHLTACGYAVRTAQTGRAALRAGAAERPDLVLLDLGLPDLDGTAVIAELRSWSTVPIIVLSVRERDQDKVRALDLGTKRAVEVMSREAQGPAAESDLHPGDLIVAVNGEAVDGIDALHRHLSRVPPGSAITLRVVRRTQLLAIPLTVREPS